MLLVASVLAASVPKLFRAKFVRADLRTLTEIVDARRDLRAVGTTADHSHDWIRSATFVAFGGRAAIGAGAGEKVEDRMATYPVAITGPRSFIVAFAPYPSGPIRYRGAELLGSQIRLGGAVRRRAQPRLPAKPLGSTTVVLGPRTLPTGVDADLSLGSSVGAAAWRGPHKSKVATSSAVPYSRSMDITEYGCEIGMSFAVVPGVGTVRLEDATDFGGGSGGGFREVLWASPEGWFIVRTTGGLAWLYPIKR